MQKSYVYLLSNKNNTVIYCGITNDLNRRIYHHKTKHFKGFTARYNCDKLVYFEEYTNIQDAIAREKQIKAGSRKKKEVLIDSINPDWKDLSEGWLFCFN